MTMEQYDSYLLQTLATTVLMVVLANTKVEDMKEHYEVFED